MQKTNQRRERRDYADIDAKRVGERKEGAWLGELSLQTASQVAGSLPSLRALGPLHLPLPTPGGLAETGSHLFKNCLPQQPCRAFTVHPPVPYLSPLTKTRRQFTLLTVPSFV